MSGRPLLEVRELEKHYPITEGVMKREIGRVRAVDGVSFDLRQGETLGLVGESGCGKTTVGQAVLRLDEPTGGTVRFGNEDVTSFDRRELKRFRRRAQMIFQDPTSSFDPRMTVGESVAEPLLIHGMRDRKRRREIVENLFERVGLSDHDVDRYPHEFSGGQKQRIALARALVVNPELIVADEPISALDVSVQAEILSLMADIQEEFGLSILFISHDMAVVQEICDRVAVMYLGEIVEVAPTDELFSAPKHPYTRALLSSIPTPDPHERGKGVRLSGDVPDPSNPPPGCRFHTRCPEIIGPDGFDLEQAEVRSVMDMREWLAEPEITVQKIKEFIVAAGRASDVESVTNEQLAEATREEFGLPNELSDPAGDAVLAEIIEAVTRGEYAVALDRLDEEFVTPCRANHPDLRKIGPDRSVACHLHDSALTSSESLAERHPGGELATEDGGRIRADSPRDQREDDGS